MLRSRVGAEMWISDSLQRRPIPFSYTLSRFLHLMQPPLPLCCPHFISRMSSLVVTLKTFMISQSHMLRGTVVSTI